MPNFSLATNLKDTLMTPFPWIRELSITPLYLMCWAVGGKTQCSRVYSHQLHSYSYSYWWFHFHVHFINTIVCTSAIDHLSFAIGCKDPVPLASEGQIIVKSESRLPRRMAGWMWPLSSQKITLKCDDDQIKFANDHPPVPFPIIKFKSRKRSRYSLSLWNLSSWPWVHLI